MIRKSDLNAWNTKALHAALLRMSTDGFRFEVFVNITVLFDLGWCKHTPV